MGVVHTIVVVCKWCVERTDNLLFEPFCSNECQEEHEMDEMLAEWADDDDFWELDM